MNYASDSLQYQGRHFLSPFPFTVALAHRLPETKAIQNADGTSHVINRVVIDFILAWVPRSGIPVDRWNSADSIQRLFVEGILAYDYSFSASQQPEIYRNLKTLVHNDMIRSRTSRSCCGS